MIARLALSLLLLLAACAVTAPAAWTHSDTPAPEIQGQAGLNERLGQKIPLDLTFRDEAGRPVRLAELISGPTVILPVYYRCTNVCSVLQTRMAAALQSLERTPVTDFRVISFSFDDTETPELASRSKATYLAAIRKPFPEAGWRFLTGDQAAIRRLTDAMGFGFQRQQGDFAHPVVSVVVAGDGTIVRYLSGVTILPKDLALAIAEAKSGIAGASIRKLVDFCFSYDPVGRGYVFNLLRISAVVVVLCGGGVLTFLLFGGRKRKNLTKN